MCKLCSHIGLSLQVQPESGLVSAIQRETLHFMEAAPMAENFPVSFSLAGNTAAVHDCLRSQGRESPGANSVKQFSRVVYLGNIILCIHLCSPKDIMLWKALGGNICVNRIQIPSGF